MFQAHLVPPVPQLWNQPFAQGVLIIWGKKNCFKQTYSKIDFFVYTVHFNTCIDS